jgi:predicted nuclease of restriction endonuclease-like (RecB) superfamily
MISSVDAASSPSPGHVVERLSLEERHEHVELPVGQVPDVRPSGDLHAMGKGLKRATAYESTLAQIVEAVANARGQVARSVNGVMTATYWTIGKKIVEEEQRGERRAGYGEELVVRLAKDLTARFGRGFGRSNLQQMRTFYLAYPEIRQTAPGELEGGEIRQTTSGELAPLVAGGGLTLPWSHYVLLLAVRNELGRQFYEAEAIRGGWTVRQLRRQIESQFYERTAMSRKKEAMLIKGQVPQPGDAVTPEEQIKDPFMLEFLGLKDEYSESELEEALIRDLETFLLELGGDFAFVGRQRRLRIGDQWFRIDLLFFHRRLRCLVVIDLKLGALSHADAGQMHMYLNYAHEHWTVDGENPPVGLILCSAKNDAVVKYALGNLPSKVLAAEYRTALPAEKLIAEHVVQARQHLMERVAPDKPKATRSRRRST